jgi:hypothetical protein
MYSSVQKSKPALAAAATLGVIFASGGQYLAGPPPSRQYAHCATAAAWAVSEHPMTAHARNPPPAHDRGAAHRWAGPNGAVVTAATEAGRDDVAVISRRGCFAGRGVHELTLFWRRGVAKTEVALQPAPRLGQSRRWKMDWDWLSG